MTPANDDAAPGIGHNQPPAVLALEDYLAALQAQAAAVLAKLNEVMRYKARYDSDRPVLRTEEEAHKALELALHLKDLIDSVEILVKQHKGPLDDQSELMRANGEAWTGLPKRFYLEMRQRLAAYLDGLEDGRQIRTEYGSLAIVRDHWKFEVTEPDAVPRPFCAPDSKLINTALRAGVRDIPGLRITREPQLVLSHSKP